MHVWVGGCGCACVKGELKGRVALVTGGGSGTGTATGVSVCAGVSVWVPVYVRSTDRV